MKSVQPVTCKLNNGMTLIIENRPGSGVFAICLSAPDRCLYEPPGKSGIGELLAGIMSDGCRGLSRGEFFSVLNSIGAFLRTSQRRSGNEDNYFNNEQSIIRLETLTRFAEKAVNLMREIIAAPNLNEDDITVRRGQLLILLNEEEIKPLAHARRIFYEKITGGHPYSHNPLGNRDSLPGISADDLHNFRNTLFQPANLVLAVETSLPVDKVVEMVEKSFSSANFLHNNSQFSSTGILPVVENPAALLSGLGNKSSVDSSPVSGATRLPGVETPPVSGATRLPGVEPLLEAGVARLPGVEPSPGAGATRLTSVEPSPVSGVARLPGVEPLLEAGVARLPGVEPSPGAGATRLTSVEPSPVSGVARLHVNNGDFGNIGIAQSLVSSHLLPDSAQSLAGSTSRSKEVNPAGSFRFLPFSPGRFEYPQNRDTSAIMMGFPVSIPPEEEAAMQVAMSLLSSHLSYRLRECQGFAYAVITTLEKTRYGSFVKVSMETSGENAIRAAQSLKEELTAFPGEYITADDIRRIRGSFRGRTLMNRLSSISRAYYLTGNYILGEPLNYYAQLLEEMETLTGHQVMEAMKKHLGVGEMVEVIVL